MKDNKSNIISTGNEKMDKLLGGGFKRKEINIVASRPADGKTLFLFDIAKFIANKEGLNVYYIHTDAFDKKVLKCENNLHYEAVNLNVFSDYYSILSNKIKNNNLDVIIIDSLNRGSNPWVEPDESQFYFLSKLAKEHNIAIIVSNELNRNMFRRKTKEQKIDDLRIFGNFREFVNNIILIKSRYADLVSISPTQCEHTKRTVEVYNSNNKKVGQFETKIDFNGYIVDDLYMKYEDAMKILQDN